MTVSHSNPPQLQPFGDDGLGPIVPVGRSLLSSAVMRLVSVPGGDDAESARRFLEFADNTGVDLRYFYAMLNTAGEVMVAVLAVPSPGRTAMVFSSHPANASQTMPTAAVIQHTAEVLDAQPTCLAQALLEVDDRLDVRAFELAGFRVLANLSYLQRAVPTRRSSPIWELPPEISIRNYTPRLRAELTALLDATYEDTLDCPGLVGLRRTEDILAGHLQTGEHDPSLWSLMYERDEPVGVLLLNPSQRHQQIELVYMGLASRVRGRGLGRMLLRYGLALLAGRAERSILLAVDEGNAPALRLYRREGFRTMMRRVAMIRPIRDARM